jgi:hypothetical protein
MKQIVVWIVCLLLAVSITNALELDPYLAFLNGILFGAVAWAICSFID